MIGEHTVTIGGQDVTCFLDELAISHGRGDTTSQPDPSAATLNLSWDTREDTLPSVVDVGAQVIITTTLPSGSVRPRFHGRITDVAFGWDDAGEATPYTDQAQLSAVQTLADLGRRVVGAESWPQENDAQRVARIASLAGMPLDLMTSDPGTVAIRPRDVDKQDALALAREVATDARGWLWMGTGGDLRYSDANHRANVAVAITLDACDVLVTPTWLRNLDGIVNDVTIGYGAASPQAEFTATNPDSIAKWERYAYKAQTQLATLDDATAIGTLLMRRNYQPAWVLSAIPVDVAALNEADTDTLLSLDMSDLVHLTGLPTIGSAPLDVYLWVEGWSETLTYGGHELLLILSDYCRTSRPVRWDDPGSTTWDTIPQAATRTWDSALCLGGPLGPGVGRWDDTPSALRWDQVAASVTWDTWTQPTTEEAA